MEIFYISNSDDTTYHCSKKAGQLHSHLGEVLDKNVQRRLIEVEPQTYNEPKASNKTTEIFVFRFI